MLKKIKNKKTSPAITIWKDHEMASVAAAHFFVDACNRAIAEKGMFIVAVPGGHTPKRFFQLLASSVFSRNIPWKNVNLFFSDERYVPHSDIDSNFRMVKENLLRHIPIPPRNIFPFDIKNTPAESAIEYEKKIRRFFRSGRPSFDLIILGVGEDGHTASLFPGTSALKEKKRLVKEVCQPSTKTWRISLTLPLINQSKQVLCLVTGKEKAPVIAKILSGKKTAELLPAQQLKPVMGVSWILDEPAIARL